MKYTYFEYPFLFNEQLLTQGTLDILGFTEYWGGCGDYGTRSLLLDGMGISMQSYIRFRELYIDDTYYNEFIKDKDEKHTI